MFKKKLQRLAHSIPPETAHGFALAGLRALPVGDMPPSDPVLRNKVWNIDFANPVGLAAGFDKNAEVAHKMFRFGFGFAEVGTITPLPQAGNPQPRIFRLAEDRAVINRLGFNNKGLSYAAERLKIVRAALPKGAVLGVNVGMNRDSKYPMDDVRQGLEILSPYADYAVVNISSPNTPGLRAWQEGEALSQLIATAKAAVAKGKPLLFKIAPDLSYDQTEYIANEALERKLDGLIVSNTTIERPQELESAQALETGGLSGRPLFRPSTKILRHVARIVKGRIPLIGAGGVSTGRDAYSKIKAGASLVQLYTAMVYAGPGIAARINAELAELLQKDGISRLADAIGVECGTEFDNNMFA